MDIEEMKRKAMLFTNSQDENKHRLPYSPHDLEMAEAKLVSNSAFDYAEQSRKVEKQLKQLEDYNLQKDKAIFETSKNIGKQVEILKEQLEKANERNELLQKSCSELEKANEQLKNEAAAHNAEREENRKAARKARRLTIAAFVLSIVLPFVSIGASVLIAIFL